ncbi:MAG: GIY-YIG nuclease family protein [Patescibacteria group bacterium]
MYSVYMLRCKDGTLYTGITTDLQRRLREHTAGTLGAQYTRTRRPLALVYSKKYRTRTTASREEARIKQLSRIDKLQLILAAGR